MFLDADFPGQDYPPTTVVSFLTDKGKLVGKVQRLLKNKARITVKPNKVLKKPSIWEVEYDALTIEDKKVKPELTLGMIHEYGRDILDEFDMHDWKFGFDLAQMRAGVCKFHKKQITLSVTYCAAATHEEIIDTVVHEIAHAIVGHKAGHGPKWQKVTKMLGGTGNRCHTVIHGEDRWEGTCPSCNDKWYRMKLNKRSKESATCIPCDELIIWKQII